MTQIASRIMLKGTTSCGHLPNGQSSRDGGLPI